jgi:two-component system sensor histidine kinase YesM
VSPDKEKNYKISGTKTELEDIILSNLDFTEQKTDVYTVNNRIVSYRYNSTMGWYLVSVTNMRVLQSLLYRIIPALIIVLIIGIFTFSVVSNRFFKTMTKGIDLLSSGMKQVEQGNFEVSVENSCSDEIGQLTSTFNHMVKQINELIISKYQQELLTQRAEFKVLQAQINPHFLYNTLDMLNWQLLLRGEDDLSNSVIAIGNLLRYSMSRDQMNVRLENEIQNIKDYLSVHYSISGKEINYKIEVQDAEKIWLPRLCLQPLIENTITHGFKERDKNNFLQITSRETKEDGQDIYILIIEDNGIGMQEDELKQLEDVYEPETSSHVGIANVKKRISYLYKGKSKMIFQSHYGYGTTILIELPVQSLRQEENGI